MKILSQATDEKLLDYIDGTLCAPEAEEIETQLRTNVFLKTRYDELKQVHDALRMTKSESPSLNFTNIVMRRLQDNPMPSTLSTTNGIILLAVVLLAVAIATVLLSKGVFDNVTTPTIDLNQINLPKYFEQPSGSFYMDLKLMINMIIVFNLGLAFMLLDRAVLRPYFKRRMG